MPTTRSQPTLGDFLVRERVITSQQFDSVMAEQRRSLHSVGRIVVDSGLISEMTRIAVLQKSFGFELLNLKNMRVDPGVLTMIPQTFAEKHRVVAVRREGAATLIVAMEDPTDLLVVDAIKNQVGLEIDPAIASLDDIQAILAQYPKAPGALPLKIRRSFRETLAYKILSWSSFPVLAILPLIYFGFAIVHDWLGFGSYIASYFKQSPNPTFEFFFYIALIWGFWSIILFEINGLLFGAPQRKKDEDDD